MKKLIFCVAYFPRLLQDTVSQSVSQKFPIWDVRLKLEISELWSRGIAQPTLKSPNGIWGQVPKKIYYLLLIRLQNCFKTNVCNKNIFSKQFLSLKSNLQQYFLSSSEQLCCNDSFLFAYVQLMKKNKKTQLHNQQTKVA